jgi:adenylate cyclase, class 2
MRGERRNLELKARDSDPGRSLETCQELGAEEKGTLLQEDTYFNVPRGRLKLRQEGGSSAHLIAYERSDESGQRESRYRLVEIRNAPELGEALASVLGVAAVVRKSRRLFLCEGVRIHLDSVEGLGSFIEFEGVAAPEDTDLRRFERSLADLQLSFGIEEADLIGESYCDLIRRGSAERRTPDQAIDKGGAKS